MFSSHRLNSPPPISHFRRPWSPLNFESTRNGTQRQDSISSESSFEALELAEYQARFPQTRQAEPMHNQVYHHSYPPEHFPEYPATPPRTFSLASRNSYQGSSPSMTSGTSSSSHVYSARLSTLSPLRRPLSLPTPRVVKSHAISDVSRTHNYPWLAEDVLDEEPTEEDFSSFPEWSRDWFRNKTLEPVKHVYEPILSFDPAVVTSSYNTALASSSIPYSSSNGSHRNLLPWSTEDEGPRTHVTAEMKKERIRMLKQEFANNSTDLLDHKGQTTIGSVDAKGKIITSGPKKRALVRWTQGLFAFGAVLASLYSAIILKPSEKPPPKGTVAAYLLYIISVVTVLLMTYVFLIRPCCLSGKRKATHRYEGPGGMMVLPIQELPGGKEKKRKNGNKGDKNFNSGINVNLIVDPAAFGNNPGGTAADADLDEEGIPRHHRAVNRRGIFEGLALEQKWKFARKELHLILLFDTLFFIGWGVVFVVILLGKRCHIGLLGGWCDNYNVATALSAFLTLLFAFSVFFDVKDLHASKTSPRTRI